MKIVKGPRDELDQTPPEEDLDQTVKPIAMVAFFNTAHGGTGWYWWPEESPEEGSVGPFNWHDQAAKHAHDEGFEPMPHRGGLPVSAASKKRE